MSDFKASKVVFSLPEKLEPNTSYWVRSGEGFDLYLSDVTGSVAYKPNVTSSQLADTLPIGKGGTGATNAAKARSNLGLGTAATRSVGYGANQVPDIKTDPTVGLYLSTNSMGLVRGDYSHSYKPKDVSSIGFRLYFTSTGMFFNGLWGSQYCDAISISSWHDSTAGKFSTLVFDKSIQKIYHGWAGYSDANWQIKTLAYEDDITQNMQVGSIASGSSSYKKGWRKLTATLPSATGEVTLAHGVTTVETVQAKVTNSDGIIIYNNDIDPTNQFYVRVNGANLILGVTANSTKVFGKAVTIYVGEEL